MVRKTIFFTVHDSNILKNLILLPESVLGLLAEDKDLSIILITPKKFADTLQHYVHWDNVKIEAVATIAPSTILERFFYFFYSYLIFTPTTRLLATFGTRVDAPPAGGNRFVAPLKQVISKTFGKSTGVKYTLVPWLYRKIFPARPYRALFEKYNPDHVFVSSVAVFLGIEMLREAQEHTVGTTAMAANWDHLNKYFIPFRGDTLLIQNSAMQREAIEWHGYTKEQVKIVGFPQFDYYVKHKIWQIPRKEVLHALNLPANARIVMFISGSVYCLDEPDIVKEMADWCVANVFGENVYVVVRKYPTAREENKYALLNNHPRIRFYSDEFRFDVQKYYFFMNLMHATDVIVSVYSTTAIEAAIFDKPVMTIGFDGHNVRPRHQSIVRLEKLSHFRNVLDTGSVVVTRSFDALKHNIATNMENPEAGVGARKKLVDRMAYRADGKCSARIVAHLRGVLT